MAADPAGARPGPRGAVLHALLLAAAARGQTAVELHAQLTARRFYERAGYVAVGRPYDKAGIAHVTMRRELADPAETRPVRPSE